VKFNLIIRRLGVALALAIVLVCALALFSEGVAGALFLPSWAALFFGWPYLSRKLDFNFPKRPAPRPPRPRSTSPKRLVITAVFAILVSVVLALAINSERVLILVIPFWLVLYYGWHCVSRRLPFLDFDKAPASPGPKRPLWLRLMRGALAWVGGIGLVLVCMSSTVIVPITLCERRAQKVHDSIRIGMTVPEVLHTARDCDVFQATSDAPYDAKANGDNIPAMSLGWRKDGSYRTYDLAARRDISLTESEVIDRLHATLHDGYQWHFRYTYINMTPQHVSFSVVFGPDGRVTEVKPVYGWD
jgi:hypothetical protein